MAAPMRPNVFDYFFHCGLAKDKDVQLFHDSSARDKDTYCSISFKPFLLEHFPATVPNNDWDYSSHETLTLLCHPSGVQLCSDEKCLRRTDFHSFILTRQDGLRTYGHVFRFFEPVRSNEITSKIQALVESDLGDKDSIFVQRSICLVTRLSYINTAEKVLRTLHKLFVADTNKNHDRSYTIESYVYNLLFEMPIPAPGNSLALIWGTEPPVIIEQPSSMELPVVDINLSALFNLLDGPVNVLRLLTSVFLEHQILLISKDCHKLMLVAEGISALMFPFQWPHIYAPVLPYTLAHHFLDAPVPYIMGIQMNTAEEKRLNLISKFDQCFVDIDETIVECPEDQPLFPNQISLVQQLGKLYKKYKRQRDAPRNEMTILQEVAEQSDETETTETRDIMPSSSLRRRNAHKRLSRSSGSNAEETTVGNKASDSDPMEDMRNLHAGGAASEKKEAVPKTPSLESIRCSEDVITEKCFNVKVRETILGSVVSLFSQYDKFVIHPNVNEGSSTAENWYLSRESQKNFDKASFLSDQPDYHLRFLSAFLETQTFASLMDNRIVAQLKLGSKDPYLRLYDDRIKQAKNMPRSEKGSISSPKEATDMDFLSRSLSIISASHSAKLSVDIWIKKSENLLRKRLTNLSGRYPRLRSLKRQDNQDAKIKLSEEQGTLPRIVYKSQLLQRNETDMEQKFLQSSSLDQATDPSWQQMQETKTKLMRQTSISEFSPEVIAQTNWKFLEKLLKDVKQKTKKLLVRKMGQEAIELGHKESAIMGLEENTLIGSLCDLLERIWCHGLHERYKQGKSALWSHLLKYGEDCERISLVPHQMLTSIHPMERNQSHSRLLNSNTTGTAVKDEKMQHMIRDRRNSQPFTVLDGGCINPIPTDLVSSIKRIQQLGEVQTSVGRCRAWIRLALEQKQLQNHFKKMLSNRPLLQMMYKRYSLLRCIDEREQFLYHLLSLNAVDFHCFTNSFTKTQMPYRVWIFPRKQLSGISQTSANVHIQLSGELNCTPKIIVPKGCLEFSFRHQNLGVLTGMIIGHDNAGLLPKWLVEFIIVRNEVTGHAYSMPCGRWLGKTVDDGSTQRLLLAKSIPLSTDLNNFLRDYTATQASSTLENLHSLHEMAGQAVNAIVKLFHRPSHERIPPRAMTVLLCGEKGLVQTLSRIFQHGLKSTGFFRKQIFPWDVVTAVCQCAMGTYVPKRESSLMSNIGEILRNTSQTQLSSPQKQLLPAGLSSSLKSARDSEGLFESGTSSPVEENNTSVRRLMQLYVAMSKQDQGLGKDEMFSLMVCVGFKEHRLPQWMSFISSVTRKNSHLLMYEKGAFMCNPEASRFLVKVLENMKEFDINLETILWRGFEDLLNE